MGFAAKQRRVDLCNKFISGASLRSSVFFGSERLHLLQKDGLGKAPKVRFMMKNAMSQVPEKPLGLYDPSFDKDLSGNTDVEELLAHMII